ncbi:hypothetical protein E2C01_023553 [Portunus trituberculatus]|uniref:Uncharacterized protein n=1 Tax=Portunus trituberculatus TaxID=210409 RepID=A0A5B7E8A1_PORTR|nr:hypothetical protein [Portunus trituberculatus]
MNIYRRLCCLPEKKGRHTSDSKFWVSIFRRAVRLIGLGGVPRAWMSRKQTSFSESFCPIPVAAVSPTGCLALPGMCSVGFV